MDVYREKKEVGNQYLPIRIYEIIADNRKGIELVSTGGFGKEVLRESYMHPTELPHWHSYYEIIWIKKCDRMVYINGENIMVKEGEIILVDLDDIHHVDTEGEIIVLHIDPFLISQVKNICQDIFPKAPKDKILKEHTPLRSKIEQNICSILELYEKKPFGYELCLMSIIYDCLGKLQEYSATNHLLEDFRHMKKEDYSKLNAIMDYVNNNYMNPIAINEIAAVVGFTPTYFCRYFKKKMGDTFLDFLNYYRCKKAEELLNKTDMSITDIALEVGFSSTSYFDKVYKLINHQTPKEYKNKVLNEKE